VISDELTFGDDYKCTVTSVWKRYEQWSLKQGYEKPNRLYIINSLEDALRLKGVERKRSVKMPDGVHQRAFVGVKLK
jgi:hypothetical protein